MTDNSLKSRIQEQTKQAMRDKDKARLSTLRTLSAAIKQKEVDERQELDDTQVISVVQKLVKQRKEALEQYQSAGRDDLARQEQNELEILKQFLPEPLSDQELDKIIEAAISETGVSSVKEMGTVMKTLKPRVEGRVDMGQLSQKVKAKLNASS